MNTKPAFKWELNSNIDNGNKHFLGNKVGNGINYRYLIFLVNRTIDLQVLVSSFYLVSYTLLHLPYHVFKRMKRQKGLDIQP